MKNFKPKTELLPALGVVMAMHGQAVGMIMAGFWLKAKVEKTWPDEVQWGWVVLGFSSLLGALGFVRGLLYLVRLESKYPRSGTSHERKDE